MEADAAKYQSFKGKQESFQPKKKKKTTGVSSQKNTGLSTE